MPAREARHLLITGAVQGVGYRWNMVQQAQSFGLTGWVRNCSDGSVESLAQGSNEALAALIAWSRSGPTGARVIQVHVAKETAIANTHDDFVQRPTVQVSK